MLLGQLPLAGVHLALLLPPTAATCGWGPQHRTHVLQDHHTGKGGKELGLSMDQAYPEPHGQQNVPSAKYSL